MGSRQSSGFSPSSEALSDAHDESFFLRRCRAAIFLKMLIPLASRCSKSGRSLTSFCRRTTKLSQPASLTCFCRPRRLHREIKHVRPMLDNSAAPPR
jgi:hypothetical protein